jgi:hypothetical protein
MDLELTSHYSLPTPNLALSMNIPSLKRLTEQQELRAMQTFFPAKRQNWDNMSRKRAVGRSTETAVQRGGR